MTALNKAYAMGTIEFEANGIDQSPQFLRTVIGNLMTTLKQHDQLFFYMQRTDVEVLEFGTAYKFEDFVENQVTKSYCNPNQLNELIDQSPALRKIHPKSQFDGLIISVEYSEINEYAQFLHSGTLKLQLDYHAEHDTIETIVLQNNVENHVYNAECIIETVGLDAMDTFTVKGIEKLIWHVTDFVDGWKYDPQEFPTLSKVIAHHRELNDPTAFYLDIYKQAGFDTLVRTDVQGYIMDEMEEHLEASPIIQALLADPIL